jgi:hypothetical protein
MNAVLFIWQHAKSVNQEHGTAKAAADTAEAAPARRRKGAGLSFLVRRLTLPKPHPVLYAGFTVKKNKYRAGGRERPGLHSSGVAEGAR